MANNAELRKLSKARLKTVRTLTAAEDWDAAAYMMGYVLETALKAASCKSLHLDTFPERTKNKHIDNCFMTHKFDQLLIVSGLSDIFNPLTGPANPSKNWSSFVQEYPTDWVSMRYEPSVAITFDKIKVSRLYQNLYGDPESIIKTIIGNRRW